MVHLRKNGDGRITNDIYYTKSTEEGKDRNLFDISEYEINDEEM